MAAFLLASLSASVVAAPKEARHTVIVNGKPAGLSACLVDGLDRRCHYEYSDGGPAASITSRIAVGKDGLPRLEEFVVEENNVRRVSESFSIQDGWAEWKSETEAGRRRVSGPVLYVSMANTPDEWGVIARALLKSKSHRLPLIPTGEARIERLGTLELSIDGMHRTVTQYEIKGMTIQHCRIWLDERSEYFAEVDPLFSVIGDRWLAAIPTLIKAQADATARWNLNLMKSASHRPSAGLVIVHAKLVDVEAGTARAGTTVVVTGSEITAIGPDNTVAIPHGAEVLDAAGKVLLPGLWDMHVHLDDSAPILNIACGVTTVRDLANEVDRIELMVRGIESGIAVGPRIIKAGIIDGTGPYSRFSVLVDSPEEARAAVDRYAELGYAQVKIYGSVKPGLVPVIINEAHARGLRVSGHVPNGMSAEEAVRSGFDEIQHSSFLFRNFAADQGIVGGPLRRTLAQEIDSVDLKSQRVADFVELLKSRHIVIDPTLGIVEHNMTARAGLRDPTLAAVFDRLPVHDRREALLGGLATSGAEDEARHVRAFAKTLELIGLLYRSGVQIVAGTDGIAGFTLYRELELENQAGIPARDVLRLATLGAARVMKQDRMLGSIAVGKVADLILVDGDPLARISDIRRVTHVVRSGVIYKPAALLDALGISAPN